VWFTDYPVMGHRWPLRWTQPCGSGESAEVTDVRAGTRRAIYRSRAVSKRISDDPARRVLLWERSPKPDWDTRNDYRAGSGRVRSSEFAPADYSEVTPPVLCDDPVHAPGIRIDALWGNLSAHLG
jgi:hypothetical protein